jgi:mono/diheme cytochrome c family protein
MKRVFIATLVAASAALAFAPLALNEAQGAESKGAATSVQNPELETGRSLFVTYCASCHGVHASGDGPMAAQLRSHPTNLTQYTVSNHGVFPAERLRRIIEGTDQSVRSHGSMEMPVWGDAFRKREGLSREEADARIEAIVRYLGAIQARWAH